MKRYSLLAAALVLSLALGAVPVCRADSTIELTTSNFGMTSGFMANDTFQLNGGAFQAATGELSGAPYNLTAGFFYQADPVVELLTPLGTTIWQIGTTVDVTWRTDVNAAGYNVRVELWRNNRKVMDLFSDYDPSGSKVHKQVVPNITTGAGYELRTVSTLLETAGHPNATITTGPNLSIAIRNGVETKSWAMYE